MRSDIRSTVFLGAFAMALSAVLSPTTAQAWGDDGHEIVALIAEHFLTANAKNKIQALLATDASSLTAHDLASEATWADKFRDSDRNTTKTHYNQTHNWHFVDLEIETRTPDFGAACNGHPALPPGVPASAGEANDCVVHKISQFAAELADAGTAPAERLQALQFLLHFLGDLHQPLHASDDHDQGGNKKNVTWTDAHQHKQSGSLHHYWDALPETLGADRQSTAAALVRMITPANAKAWSKGTPERWAAETFKQSLSAAYGGLSKQPDSEGNYALSAAYVTKSAKVASLQLRRAGVRLAAVLNNALK